MKTVVSKLRKFIPVLLVSVIGTALTIILFLEVRAGERKQLDLEFKSRAHDYAGLIKDVYGDRLETVGMVADFFEFSTEVTKADFSGFTRRVLAAHPDIVSLAWIPRVRQEQRLDIETRAKAEAHPDFYIKALDDQGEYVRSKEQAEYFPVYFAEPADSDAFLLGYDESSDPIRKAALDKARDSGRPAVTSRIVLRRGVSGYGCRVFYPIYPGGRALSSGADSSQELHGFVSVLFHVGAVVEGALRNRNSGDL